MVDQALVEQNHVNIDDKPEGKPQRKRNDRNRNRRQQNENASPAGAEKSEEQVADHANGRTSRRNRREKPRAPRVRTENDNVVKEKADYTDGILRLKISNSRPRTVYTRLVRLMLAGYDGSGNPLDTQNPIETIEVSALGNAIGSAIFVADNLIKGSVVEQVAMSADFVSVEGDQVTPASENRFKGSPRLLMTLKKLSSWDAKEDDVLQKTRVYRSKVLGIKEESADNENASSE